MTEAVLSELARLIAGFAAPGGSPRRPTAVPEPEWSRLLALLKVQRISGFAVAAAEAGVLQLTPEQYPVLLERHREAMAWSLVVERTMLEMAGHVGGASIPYAILKGPSFAHTVYPDPSWRAFGDLDLLVDSVRWRSVSRMLEEAGAERDIPEPRPGFDERFGKAVVFQTDEGVQVDLHVRLALGPFGMWIEAAELLAHAKPLSLGGCSLWRLEDTDALLHACVHASLGTSPPLLVPLRDVVQLSSVGHIDWARFHELTARWRLGVVVRHAMRQAQATLRVSLPEGADRSLAYPATAREEGLLRSYTRRRQTRGGVAVATLRALPGLSSKASYIRALVLPDRDFLAARTGSRGLIRSHLRRWKIPVGWARTDGRE